MEKQVTLFLTILLVGILVFSLADSLTGRYISPNQLGTGSKLKSSLENTKLVVSPQTVKAGGVITVDIYPGKDGVFAGLAIYSNGGMRKYGSLCSQQAIANFCSNSYKCIDQNPERCTSGPKCYGAKRMVIRTSENWYAGRYTVKVCDAVGDCQDCKNPITYTFNVV